MEYFNVAKYASIPAQIGWANIRHIFNIRIMNIFNLLFEYSNIIRSNNEYFSEKNIRINIRILPTLSSNLYFIKQDHQIATINIIKV
jgi:hypothetical protein